MQELETIRRISTPFWAGDDFDFERCPAYRRDGTQIKNAFEYRLREVVQLGNYVAQDMIVHALGKNRKIGSPGGDDVHIKFNFSTQREGNQMIIVCDVTRYGKAKG